MYLHLKQSGELLTDRPGVPWTRDALMRSAEQIRDLHRGVGSLGLHGVMVVPGAGNILRGSTLRDEFGPHSAVSQWSDAAGRIATEQNAVVLAGALKDLQVPHTLLCAPTMSMRDDYGITAAPYTTEAARAAYLSERVVLIAGGAGLNGQTTDAAIMDYTFLEAAAFCDAPSTAFKATKHPGIFDRDPDGDPTARRYAQVSAQYMLQHGLGGVDDQCLRLIARAEGTAELLVYSAEHSPLDVLRYNQMTHQIGTLITSRQIEEPIYVSAA